MISLILNFTIIPTPNKYYASIKKGKQINEGDNSNLFIDIYLIIDRELFILIIQLQQQQIHNK